MGTKKRGYHYVWVDRDNEVEECIKAFNKELPQEVIYATDVSRRGVILSERAHKKYLEENIYDSKEGVDVFNWDLQAVHQNQPYQIILRSGSVIPCRYGAPETQPYTIDVNEEGDFCIKACEHIVLDYISFPTRPRWYGKTTSTGKRMEHLAHSKGLDNPLLIPYRHCHYWNTGDQCVFCDIEENNRKAMKLSGDFPLRWNEDEIYEVATEVLKEKGRFRGGICATGGTDARVGNDVEYWSMFSSAVKRAAQDLGYPGKPLILTQMAPVEKQGYITLREAGFDAIGNNIEIWSEWQWPLVVPGKHKFVGRETWLKRMLEGVEVFGRGLINSEFVVGVIMAPKPYGYGPDSDVDNAVKETMEGFEWCWENGISCAPSHWSVASGSLLAKLGASQPPLEFYLKITNEYYNLMKELVKDRANNLGMLTCRCYKDEIVGIDPHMARLIYPELKSQIPDHFMEGFIQPAQREEQGHA